MKSASKLSEGVGRMQFLVVAGLRSPFHCWLSGEVFSLKAVHIPSKGSPPSSSQ